MNNQENNNEIDNNNNNNNNNQDIKLDKLEKIKNIRKIYWKEEEEIILKRWADKGQCYEWMQSKAHISYKRKLALFTIPVIILSTLTGTANFAQDRFSEDYRNLAVMIIGALNILAGIITTIAQFLKIGELNESTRISALSWGKFNRNIKTVLCKHPLDRDSPDIVIKYSKEEYDRLIEISPLIPKFVVKKFNKRFKNITNYTKPEICIESIETDIYDMSTEDRNIMINNITKELDRKNKGEIVLDIIEDIDKKDNSLEKFRNTYYAINGKFPSSEEINKFYKPIKRDDTIDPIIVNDDRRNFVLENLDMSSLDKNSVSSV